MYTGYNDNEDFDDFEKFDDGDDDYEFYKPKNYKNTKLKQNPAGPFKIKLLFRGVEFKIVIENISINEYEISLSTDKKVSNDKIESLKKYLEYEGFEEAARKHNLMW